MTTLTTFPAQNGAVESIVSLLSTINDPEVPAINIVDLGIVREIQCDGHTVAVTITPTYSGCPAMSMIEDEIRRVLQDEGFSAISIRTVLSPAWTTDWMTDEAKEKLRRYGIAPPPPVAQSPLLQIQLPAPACPYCRSLKTSLQSEFGSTACKSLFFCHNCHQPFEHFKAL